MNEPLSRFRDLDWKSTLACVAVAVCGALVYPWIEDPVHSFPVVFAASTVAYFVRRSRFDALLFAIFSLAVEMWAEPTAGPLALCSLSFAVLALTVSPRFSLFLGSGILVVLLVAADLKRRYAGSALTTQDVHYFLVQFQDNIGVAGSQPTVLGYLLVAIVAFPLATIVCWRLDSTARRRSHSFGRRRTVLVKVAAWGMAAGCAGTLAIDAHALIDTGSAWEFGQSDRPILTFLSTLGLDPKPQFEIVDTTRFSSELERTRRSHTASANLPDIVVFLQESQFNPLEIAGCPPTLCQLPIFEDQSTTTDRGDLRVHTYGAGTWLTEFTFETGLPHTLFGKAGNYAPFNVAPGVDHSFVRSLKNAGYYAVAVYPVGGGMMNARSAYLAYGFDEFLDRRELKIPRQFGYRVPDSYMHEAAVRTLKSARAKGKPVLVVAVTIFNHHEHGIHMNRVPEMTRTESGKFSDDVAEADNLADYIWRTSEFESAYAETRRQLVESDHPLVLAWFGDHQPPFSKAPRLASSIGRLMPKSAAPAQMLTWYNIESNLSPKHPTHSLEHQLDIAFLPGLIAERSGVPYDRWLAANLLARRKCGGLLIECKDPYWRDAYYTYLLRDLRVLH